MFLVARDSAGQDVIRHELTGEMWISAHNGFVNANLITTNALRAGLIHDVLILDYLGRVVSKGALTHRTFLLAGTMLSIQPHALVVGMVMAAETPIPS